MTAEIEILNSRVMLTFEALRNAIAASFATETPIQKFTADVRLDGRFHTKVQYRKPRRKRKY